MSAPLVGLDYTYTFKRETAFGTAVTASGTQIPTEELSIDHAPVAHQIQRATGLRGTIHDDAWQDQVGSTPTASCAFYLSLDMMQLLPAVLQNSTDWTDSASIWTLSTKNYSSLPDFSASEGYFYTLLMNSPVSSGDDAYITTAIGNSMTLSIAPDANEGALYCSMDFIGKTSTTGATVAPTVSAPDMSTLFKWSDIQKVMVGLDNITNDFISAEWTITNNAKAIPSAPARDFALLRWEVTGSFTMLDDSAIAESLKAMCLNTDPGGAVAFQVYFNASDTSFNADGQARINCFIVLNEFSIDNSEEAKVTFNWTGHFNSAGTTVPFELKYYQA